MTDDLITRAENALEGVTDGPWIAAKEREARQGRNQGWIYPGNIVSDATKQIVFSQTGNTANSRFIAAARSLVPELVAALKAAQRERDGIEHDRDFILRELAHTDAALKAAQAEVEQLQADLPRRIDPTPLCPYGCDCGECYGYVHDSGDCHCVKRAKLRSEAAARGRQYGERFGI